MDILLFFFDIKDCLGQGALHGEEEMIVQIGRGVVLRRGYLGDASNWTMSQRWEAPQRVEFARLKYFCCVAGMRNTLQKVVGPEYAPGRAGTSYYSIEERLIRRLPDASERVKKDPCVPHRR